MTITFPPIILVRVTVALIQGISLYFLYHAFDAKSWPATDGLAFAPLMAVALFVPTIVVAGFGNLSLRILAIWAAIATALSAGLTIYDIYRDPIDSTHETANPRLIPALSIFVLMVMLFILHSLVVAGYADRKFIANYSKHFDAAWKQGVQIVLSAGFVAAFWAVLFLGSALFQVIKLDFLSELIKHSWFWIPVTMLMFSCAIHITDVHAGIVRGARTLTLTLLSWLLPLMTMIAVAFVLTLPFTGLTPLWSTRTATPILLTATAALVFLINTVYQDGQLDTPISAFLRYSNLVAIAALPPLVGLATYGLMLRVVQYGWTPQRIVALACVVIAICYATSYAITAIRFGTSLRGLASVNVNISFVILAVLLVLFTPIGDPARISVADQVARLRSGRTAVDKFDFTFLRFGAGRYGLAALEQLAASSGSPQELAIAMRAQQFLRVKTRWEARVATVRSTPELRTANIAVIYPVGQTLPESFLHYDWNSLSRRSGLPDCLTDDRKCEAILTDFDGDGNPEILILSALGSFGTAFKLHTDGTWVSLGSLSNIHCPGVREALRAGKFETVPSSIKEIEVSGNRLRINTRCVETNPG